MTADNTGELANAVQFATRTGQTITWTREDGTAQNLTGATLTGFIIPRPTGPTRAITGTLAIVTAASGIFTWTYSAADVATSGDHKVQFVATYGVQGADRTFRTDWWVDEGLVVAE